MHKPPSLRDTLQQMFSWLSAALAAGISCAVIRYQLVEPVVWINTCAQNPWDGWCAMRSIAIELFVQQRIGWFAVALGLFGAVIRHRVLAGLGLITGTAAVLLYAAELGALGVLLGLLGLVGQSPPGRLARSIEPPRTAASNENDNA